MFNGTWTEVDIWFEYNSPPYLCETYSKAPSGCLKLQIVPYLVYTVLFPFYIFSLAHLNCQHHHCCALGPLWSKTRWLGHKHCDTVTVDLITKRTTKGLSGGEHTEPGEAGQRVDACFGWGWSRITWDFITLFRVPHNLNLTNCLLLELSI